MEFSGALKLTGIDDFIGASQACTKPVEIPKPSTKRGFIAIEDDGKYVEVMESGEKVQLQTAKITLNDCLACSGCVTTAESMLVEAQSISEFFTNVEKAKKLDQIVVVSVSQQARASLAAHYKLSHMQTYQKLITLLKSFGVDYVFDTSFARDFSLLEMREEFVNRYRKQQSLPLIVSACPGWICYAEKAHGDYILPYISTTKSPQQVTGSLVKQYFASKINKTSDKIYHTALMPCADKKLEASREDFVDTRTNTREVDCVLTSMEVAKMIEEKGIDFAALSESPVDKLYINQRAWLNHINVLRFNNVDNNKFYGSSGGSGGYLETTFRYAAKELFNVEVHEVEFKAGRNNDCKEVTLEVEGQKKLSFAIAYGFKNIQNIVQKMKKSSCPYQFIEIMACPSGCLNGGGQIRAVLPETSKDLVKRVNEIYHSDIIFTQPHENKAVVELYQSWIKDKPYSSCAQQILHTSYHNRKNLPGSKSALTW